MTVTIIWVLVAIIAAVAIVRQIVILSALYRALHELTLRVERSAGWLEQMTMLIVITIQMLAEDGLPSIEEKSQATWQGKSLTQPRQATKACCYITALEETGLTGP